MHPSWIHSTMSLPTYIPNVMTFIYHLSEKHFTTNELFDCLLVGTIVMVVIGCLEKEQKYTRKQFIYNQE